MLVVDGVISPNYLLNTGSKLILLTGFYVRCAILIRIIHQFL